jgi:probable rRNA maturation factor
MIKKTKAKKNTVPQIKINLQIIYKAEYIPKMSQFKTWAKAALLERRNTPSEINIRIVDVEESAALNAKYRHKSGATNILSFPYETQDTREHSRQTRNKAVEQIAPGILGDLVICAPLVLEEALKQKKTIEAHWAHLTIHGVLHLLGYTHDTAKDAEVMENLEIELLKKLGYENPY